VQIPLAFFCIPLLAFEGFARRAELAAALCRANEKFNLPCTESPRPGENPDDGNEEPQCADAPG
jgi:hypothetical protein